MKKLTVGILSLVTGISLLAAGPDFVDKNGDGICDVYVSRGSKTAYEAGVTGNGQYRNPEAGVAGGRKIMSHKFRSEAPGQGRNRK